MAALFGGMMRGKSVKVLPYIVPVLVALFFRDAHAADVRSLESSDYVKVTLLDSAKEAAKKGTQASGVKFEFVRDGKVARVLGGREFNFCELRNQSETFSHTLNLSVAQMGIGLAGGATTLAGGAVCVSVGILGGGVALATPVGVAICGGTLAAGAATFKAVSSLGNERTKRTKKAGALSAQVVEDRDVLAKGKITEFADLLDGALKEINSSVASDSYSKCSIRVSVGDAASAQSSERAPTSVKK